MKHPIFNAPGQHMTSTWRERIAQATPHREFESRGWFAEPYKSHRDLHLWMRPELRQQWGRSVTGVALLLAMGQAPALAATINVNTTCTLARAIVSANNDASGFCTPGSGADTINLPVNSVRTLNAVNNTVYGPTGLPVVRSVITVNGNQSTISRTSTAPHFRLFAVGIGGNLTLRAMTLRGGVAPKTPGNDTANDGGAVLSLGGNLTLIGSTVSNNLADRGGGVAIQGAAPAYARVSATIINSTLSDNTAVAGEERTSGWGGGIDIDPYTDLIVSNSTISNNDAASSGGGIYALTGSVINMTNTTMFGNDSAKRAGAIATGCATLTMTRNLISGNTAPLGSEMSTSTAGCQVTDLRQNLFGHNGLTNAQAFNNFAVGVSDLTATADGNTPTALSAILSSTLADNGGTTKTHSLVSASPAIDSAIDGTCPPPATDQRGVARPKDGNGDGAVACDIGSFELTATTPVTETCGGLPATIVGTPGDESIPGTEGADVIDGLGGVDTISGLGGNDVICGGLGNDTILTGPANDRAFGEDGNDIVRGGDGADQLNGGAGGDQLFGDQLNDSLTGGAGTDRCDGGTGTDTAATCETRISIP